jgi:hypothetical protein
MALGLPQFLVRKGRACARLKKKHKKRNPHIGMGTPRIGMGRDMSIFQIGESP